MAVNFDGAGNIRPNVERVINPKTKSNAAQSASGHERALEVEQLKKVNPPVEIKTDKTAIQALDQHRQQQNQTTLDNPGRESKKALSAYQQIANQEKRNEIESLVGVDIYV